jgi:hypothetical protein
MTPSLIALTGCDATGSRQQRVAERGSHVMPFDLDKTMHHFNKTDDGGIQRVVATEPVAQRQVSLIRKHLRHEAKRFSAGDFTDPARIHGQDMPGLQTLQKSAEKLDIQYQEVPQGAEIRYRAEAPKLVRAIHNWFDAQVSDHGDHATSH